MKKLKMLVLTLVLIAAFTLIAVSGCVFADVPEEQPVSFKIATESAVESVKQNPISLPDWWYMTVDLVGNMVLKAIKSGNINLALIDSGVLGGYVKVYEGTNINVIFGANRDGKFLGIEPNKPLPFQENLVEELRKLRPQLAYNFDTQRVFIAVEYPFLED